MEVKRNIRDIAQRAYFLKKKIEDQTKELEALKDEMFDYLSDGEKNEGKKTIIIPVAGTKSSVSITKVERVSSLVYDTRKLKMSLPKEVYEDIIDKTYIITNINAMKKMLKKAGITASEFRKLIMVTEKVNNGKIQQAFSVGEVTDNDLAGAYTATISKSVRFKLNENGCGEDKAEN